jgi:hypothetical protein
MKKYTIKMFHSKNVNFCFHIYVMNNKKYDFHKKQKNAERNDYLSYSLV